MTAASEYGESWHRLTDDDLTAISIICANPKLPEISREMAVYLKLRLMAELRHREELSTMRVHAFPWDVANSAELSRCFLASLAIRQGAIHTATLAEWAGLMHDSVCSEMNRRLTVHPEQN